MKAKFEIKCEEMGFSRSQEMPIDSRGYCHQLAEDLSRAMEFYSIRVENHLLKQKLQKATDALEKITKYEVDRAPGYSSAISALALTSIQEHK